MKIAAATSTLVSTNVAGAGRGFAIKKSPMAFKILSSSLYSDKIESVLRELGCNAADAHKMNGKGHVPFDVKLPSAIDPEFFIQDFGPGLSKDAVYDLYTTYFASSKTDDDNQTGGFGLGSKSPFAYTDNFSITSCHDGVQRSFTAFIGEGGEPTVMEVDCRPVSTGWPTGVRVSMAVKPEDFSEFKRKAAIIFGWFDTVPNGVGKIEQKGEWFGQVFVPNVLTSAKSLAVLMGNVVYPVQESELGVLSVEQRAALEVLMHLGTVIKVPVGSLMPTASRESLDYTPEVRLNLGKLIENRAREFLSALVAETKDLNLNSMKGCQALHRVVSRYFGVNYPRALASNSVKAGPFAVLGFHSLTEAGAVGLAFLDSRQIYMSDWYSAVGNASVSIRYRGVRMNRGVRMKMKFESEDRMRRAYTAVTLERLVQARIVVNDMDYVAQRADFLSRDAGWLFVFSGKGKEAAAQAVSRLLLDTPVELMSELDWSSFTLVKAEKRSVLPKGMVAPKGLNSLDGKLYASIDDVPDDQRCIIVRKGTRDFDFAGESFRGDSECNKMRAGLEALMKLTEGEFKGGIFLNQKDADLVLENDPSFVLMEAYLKSKKASIQKVTDLILGGVHLGSSPTSGIAYFHSYSSADSLPTKLAGISRSESGEHYDAIMASNVPTTLKDLLFSARTRFFTLRTYRNEVNLDALVATLENLEFKPQVAVINLTNELPGLEAYPLLMLINGSKWAGLPTEQAVSTLESVFKV